MKRKYEERPDGSRRVMQIPKKGSRVEQHHRDKVNINSIMKKYYKTGMLEQRSGARYGDFTSFESFHDAQDRILQATDEFMELPSDIRAMFDNDPAMLVEFINDPANEEQARNLGLIPPVGGMEAANPSDGGKEAPKSEKAAESVSEAAVETKEGEKE